MVEPFEVTDANFQKQVLQSQTPVLVDFWAEWCGPCKAIAPDVHAIAQEYASQLRVGKLDVDNNSNTPAQLGILGIPTLILFKNGQAVERITGRISKDRLVAKLKPHLDS
jgi:thioredoxin 1